MTSPDASVARARPHQMIRIRRFEEKCAELYSAGKIRGFLHLCVGEEAVSAGVMPALGPDDAVVSTYREHGHALARGIPSSAVMAEMFGKREGCSGGRGGSMHLFDVGRRFYGGNAIVAGGLPLAVGLALGDAMQKRERVTACFFGDGAMAEGEFHESINLAALWKLPVLFLCENNQYAMGTALHRHQSETELARKAESYRVFAERVDGMNVGAVEAAARRGVEHVRAGRGPYFIEFLTYRFRAHSMFDPELYRDRAEVERWKLRDPIQRLVLQAVADGELAEDAAPEIEREVAAELEEAIAFAEAGTWEAIEDLTKDVLTPPMTLMTEGRP
jgi:pyruvate dehydrogenase E1 component alpha subunit